MLRILHDTKYDFIKYWKVAVLATVAFIVLGMALMGYHKFRTGNAINYSIEFTGGTEIQLHFGKGAVPTDVVRSSVHQAGYGDAEVASFGAPDEFLVKVRPSGGAVAAANADSVGVTIVNTLSPTASPRSKNRSRHSSSVSSMTW